MSKKEAIILGVFILIIFIGGVKLGETGKKIEVVEVIKTEYCQMAWWFNGDRLHWAFDGRYDKYNFLEFQLDNNMPPTVNMQPIKNIKVFPTWVLAITEDNAWVVHYGPVEDDWYVEKI